MVVVVAGGQGGVVVFSPNMCFHVSFPPDICQLFKGRRAASGAQDPPFAPRLHLRPHPPTHCVTLIITLKNKTDIQFR